jgi:predicted transcriptional regulator of viral defense system
MSKLDPIVRALTHHQLMSHAELVEEGASGVKLRRMVEAGLIVSVGSGIYASTELDPFVAAVLATAKYYPQAIISGITALQIHELAQEYVEKVDIDISRGTSIRNKMLQVHRVPPQRLTGMMELKFHGSKIRIYDIERTLCEAYHLDPSGPLFFKALKRYVALGKVKASQIQKYDQELKTHVLMHLQQELADA